MTPTKPGARPGKTARMPTMRRMAASQPATPCQSGSTQGSGEGQDKRQGSQGCGGDFPRTAHANQCGVGQNQEGNNVGGGAKAYGMTGHIQPSRLSDACRDENRDTHRRGNHRDRRKIEDKEMGDQRLNAHTRQGRRRTAATRTYAAVVGMPIPMMRQITATISATRKSCSPATLTTRVDSVTPIPVMLSMATRI